MKVLIVSTDSLSFSPSGPAYVAGAAREAGHAVEVFDCLLAENPVEDLCRHVDEFDPAVIGVSIRTVAGKIVDENSEYYTKPFDSRAFIKRLIDRVKSITSAKIILGGSGFNYYSAAWLEYLDLDYGIRGEAEISFPLCLSKIESSLDIDTVPGCVCRSSRRIIKVDREFNQDLDSTAFPAYDLFDLEEYSRRGITAAVFTKRGCAFRCTFCPYSSLEGTRYRLKSAGRVVDEIQHILHHKDSMKISFCDNSFNVPKRHAESICREIVKRGLSVKWQTGALKPFGITNELCELFKDSGCVYLNVSVEAASDKMLESMHRGYTAQKVKEALDCLAKSDIPTGISIMFGAPGETPETINETLHVVDEYAPHMEVFVTIGLNLWTHHQQVLQDASRDGQLNQDTELFDEAHYISPDLPEGFMIDLIETLHTRKRYGVQVNKRFAASGS